MLYYGFKVELKSLTVVVVYNGSLHTDELHDGIMVSWVAKIEGLMP